MYIYKHIYAYVQIYTYIFIYIMGDSEKCGHYKAGDNIAIYEYRRDLI